jgi:hypothetical protein
MANEIIGYRITRTGGVTAYRITQEGLIRATYSPSAPVPAWLIPILQARGMIYDPASKDIMYVEAMPNMPPAGVAFTTGNGNYMIKEGGEWITLPTKFTDAGIEDVFTLAGGSPVEAACLLIDRLIARIQPDDYLTSGNAGGQSMSFPSLADMLAFYRGIKKDLQDEAARINNTDAGRFFQFRRPAVGGVWENGDE